MAGGAQLVLVAALGLGGRDGGDPGEVLVPWSQEHEARVLEELLRERHGLGDVRVVQVPDTDLDLGRARTADLLLGYDLSTLGRLAAVLAPFPDPPGTPLREGLVAHLFWESWAPVVSTAEGAAAPATVRAWRDLMRDELWGWVRLRFPEADAPDSLVLGALAAELEGTPGFVLERLVLGSLDERTLWSPRTSWARVLEGLPPGAIAIAPVREVERARSRNVPVQWIEPEEGVLALPLGAAFPDAAAAERVARLGAILRGEALVELCRVLELEPAVGGSSGLPDWMARAAARRIPVDPDGVAGQRRRVAELYGGSLGEPPGESESWGVRAFDLMALLVSFGLLGYAALRIQSARRATRSS